MPSYTDPVPPSAFGRGQVKKVEDVVYDLSLRGLLPKEDEEPPMRHGRIKPLPLSSDSDSMELPKEDEEQPMRHMPINPIPLSSDSDNFGGEEDC